VLRDAAGRYYVNPRRVRLGPTSRRASEAYWFATTKEADQGARDLNGILGEHVYHVARLPSLPADVLRWNDGTIPRLALALRDTEWWCRAVSAAYRLARDEGAVPRLSRGPLPVDRELLLLADALLDAGYNDDALADECRELSRRAQKLADKIEADGRVREGSCRERSAVLRRVHRLLRAITLD
jgi:hypothetical protein